MSAEPHNDRPAGAIERELLGVLLRYPAELADARDQLQVSDFAADAHQKIYAALVGMHDRREVIDAAGLSSVLKQAGHLEDVGWELLADLAGYSGTSFNVGRQIARVLSLSLERGLILTLSESLAEVQNPTGPPEEMLDRALARLDKLTARVGGMEATPIAAVMASMIAELDKRISGQVRSGLPTGFPAVDELFCGGLPLGLTILAARPSVGKTAIALHIARNVCDAGGRVLFVSLEQPQREVGERLAAGVGRVSGGSLRSGRMSAQDVKDTLNASDHISRWRLWVNDVPGQTAGQIAAGARQMRRKAGGLDLIIVDYLTLIRPDNPKASKNEQIGESTRRIREMARELSVPVLLLSQLNRQAAESDGPPKLHHLRDSGEIEQHADAVCFLHRAAPWQPNVPDKIEFWIEKQRNGPLGVVTFDHDSKVYTFSETTPVL